MSRSLFEANDKPKSDSDSPPASALLPLRSRTRIVQLNVIILLTIILLAGGLRFWRLDQPQVLQFDEGYFARSASEWLSNQNNDWTQEIREWTHPMLGKYIIAASMTAVDPNRVIGSLSLSAPADFMAVAPRYAQQPSWLFMAADSEIFAVELESGREIARWEAGASISALHYDANGSRLLVATAESGELLSYSLDSLRAADPKVPSRRTISETNLNDINQIIAAEGNTLLRGSDGITILNNQDQISAHRSLHADGVAYIAASDSPARIAISNIAQGQVTFYNAKLNKETHSFSVESSLIGPLLLQGADEQQQLFALTGPLPATEEHSNTEGGLVIFDADDPALIDVSPLPGKPQQAIWQPSANLVYVTGEESGVPTLWTVLPHGQTPSDDVNVSNVAFDSTVLSGPVRSLAMDVSPHAGDQDNGHLLLGTSDRPSAIVVDVNSNSFAWRAAGALFGALLAGLVYLLALSMFQKRWLATAAGALVALDSMNYSMSRIATSDIFLVTFIVAAYLVFWQIWGGSWKRQAWWMLPLVGVCIGLAIATKWIGFYPLLGLLALILVRSALGRHVLLGLASLLAVVMGIGAPWPFMLLAFAGVLFVLILIKQRGGTIQRGDMRGFLLALAILAAVVLPFVLTRSSDSTGNGVVEVLFGTLAHGIEAVWPVIVLALASVGLLVARCVFTLKKRDDLEQWWQPTAMHGLSWAWIGVCLLAIPLFIYGLTYVPYLQLGHPLIGSGGPGHGWSLEELHVQMFNYHFNLTRGHAAASPWWSWPLALKPVWLYVDNLADGGIATIYNHGNLLLFWASLPAMAAASWWAWRRRSYAFALLVVAFAFQWLPWTRIERASFAYHYLTALPFAFIAIAYLIYYGLRSERWRPLTVAFLVTSIVAGLLLFPLSSAWTMPSWYFHAFNALPPWDFDFQLPIPDSTQRELFGGGLKLIGGLVLAALLLAWTQRRPSLKDSRDPNDQR